MNGVSASRRVVRLGSLTESVIYPSAQALSETTQEPTVLETGTMDAS